MRGHRRRRRRACGRMPAALCIAVSLGGCAPAPRTFDQLYAKECAGCHGADGWNGSAIPLANPVYLAWADDAAVRQAIAGGRPGTGMPAFSRNAGGSLDDGEIDVLLRGMRDRWARPVAGIDGMPPYEAPPAATGLRHVNDIANGAAVYVGRCVRCHEGPLALTAKPGSPRDPATLARLSDQGIRTLVVAGRPDRGMPDWRGDQHMRGLSEKHVDDVVTYLANLRRKAR